MTHTSKPHVGFIYHFMPDYREPVFKSLLNDNRIESEFIAGTNRGEFASVPATDLIPFIRVKNRWCRSLLWQSGVHRLIREKQYDVVVFRGSWLTLSTWTGAIYARWHGCTVMFWLIGWRKPESGLRGFLRPRYLRLAHALLLYGERSRQLGEQQGYPADRMRVIGNSLPFDSVDLEDIKEPTDSLLVLWVTRLLPYKKPQLLIEAIVIAHQRGFLLECVFVGPGDTQALQALADQHNLGEYISFTGRLNVDGAELPALFARARVVAVPGHAGLTVANGLVNGVPVVVNDNPDSNPPEWEYVQPATHQPDSTVANGSYFKEDDAASLADELIRWCVTAPATTEHRRSIARQAQHEVSPQRSSDAIVDAVFHFTQ